MTTEATEAPRANRDGHPCPAWCTTDHNEPLIDGKPELGYSSVHRSDPMTPTVWPALVKVSQYPGDAAEVQLQQVALIMLLPERAEILAGILEHTARLGESAVTQLAAELRTAAAIARESR